MIIVEEQTGGRQGTGSGGQGNLSSNSGLIIPMVTQLFPSTDQATIHLRAFDEGSGSISTPPLFPLLATMYDLSQVSTCHSIGVALIVERMCAGLDQDRGITNGGRLFLRSVLPEFFTAALLHDIGKFWEDFISHVTDNSNTISGENRKMYLEQHPEVGFEWFVEATQERRMGNNERTLTAGAILLHHYCPKRYPKFHDEKAWGMAEKGVCSIEHEIMLRMALEYWMDSKEESALNKIRNFINYAGQYGIEGEYNQALLEALCIFFVSSADVFESLSGKRAYQRSGHVPSYLQAIAEFEESDDGIFHMMHRLILQDDLQEKSEEIAERSVRGIVDIATKMFLHLVLRCVERDLRCDRQVQPVRSLIWS
ncbi:MAG: HD domain-containing protein [Candidatus Dojkabacteria bacterium]